MNIVIQPSQPAPNIYSLSSRIISVTSVIVIFTLIVALILQCIKSWHMNFISDLTIAACACAHLCWVLSTVNMLSQDISKRLIRLNVSPLYLYSCPLTILHFEQLCYEAPQLEVLFLMLWSTTMFLKLFIKHSIRQTWKVKYVFALTVGLEPTTP